MPSSKKLQSNKDYDLFINNLESMLSNINNEKDINKNYINIENIVLFLSRECFNIDAKDYDFLNDEKSSKKTAQAWFYDHPIIASKKAKMKLRHQNIIPFDIKIYWFKKILSNRIKGGVHFTENFEDNDITKDIHFKYNLGIDIFINEKADGFIIALSKNGVVRTLEIKNKLNVTQKTIFKSWYELRYELSVDKYQEEEYRLSQREYVHNILWNSFELKTINEEFYAMIAERFTTLYQHLFKEKIFNDKDAKLFSNLLIARLLFIWFLRKKDFILYNYFDLIIDNDTTYYKNLLSKLFFDVLNTEIKDRDWQDRETPYLNGGLFNRDEILDKNNISFPNGFFTKLYNKLDEYNFTIDESSVDYEQVAIDPEMLGKVFENLLACIPDEEGKPLRKSTGSFYTPRQIVNYMCEQSIREYLYNQYPDNNKYKEEIDYIIDTKDFDWENNSVNDNLKDIKYKKEILIALGYNVDYKENKKEKKEENKWFDNKLKIFDPACGSGAYPVGMLQLLNKLFFRLDRRLDVYEVKYNILRNNIYGCDISQIAVHITRLRMFLSLVIDQELDDKKSNKGIAPLPNLDFKFVCANTLISLPDGSKMQGGLFDSIDKNKLKELRDDYFATASKNKKIKLREKYLEEIKPKLGSSQFDDMIGTYKPFDNSNVASFYDPSLMHGVDGFDIVIGNPPYVGEKGNKETFQPIAKSPLGVRFYNGKMDLFYFFFHIALDLLKVNGVMAYITTNYYITATGAKKLKIDMRDRSSILNLINFGELKIFDSALGQHNLITILQKGNIDKKAKTVNVNRKGKADAELLNNITSGVDSDSDYYELNQNQLFSGENIKLTNGGLDDVLDKIKNKSQSLDSICDVNQGLRTGADKVTQKHINDTKLNLKNGDGIFIINSNEKENIKLDSVELDYIKPLYKNSDIYKWGTNLTTKYNLIDLFFPNNKNINIKTIPNIMNHLSKYKKILEHRKENANGINKQIEKGNYYFASVRRKLDFDQEKIVAPQRSKTNTFGYNNVPWYASADVYFITQPKDNYTLKFLLGILNSKLIYIWLYNRGKRKGEMLELYQEPLANIPIPLITPSNQQIVNKIESLVQNILDQKAKDKDTNTKDLEKEIDTLVYEMYGLTEEEVKIIENK